MIQIKLTKFTAKNRKEIIALANSFGGTLTIGLRPDGSVSGLRKYDRLEQQVREVVKSLKPVPEVKIEPEWRQEHERFLIHIHVLKSQKWVSYVRQGYCLSGVSSDNTYEVCELFQDQWDGFWRNVSFEVPYEDSLELVNQKLQDWKLYAEKTKNLPRTGRGELIQPKDLDISPRSLELRETEDGSHTLFFKELNETYHSLQGAEEESQYVFVDRGMLKRMKQMIGEDSSKQKLRILEIGFGTGLNAGLSVSAFLQHGEEMLDVEYHTLEPYPLEWSVVDALAYDKYWDQRTQNLFEQMHTFANKEVLTISSINEMKFQRVEEKLEDYQAEIKYDVIYFDAFAPDRQLEIWSRENLQKCYDLLDEGGILTTYCANGAFKRTLGDVGFDVQLLPGPKGRREMVQGVKA